MRIELHSKKVVTIGEETYEAQRIIKLLQVDTSLADEVHLKFSNGTENDVLLIVGDDDNLKINGKVIPGYLPDRVHAINNFYNLN